MSLDDAHPLSRTIANAEVHDAPISALAELTHACNVDCEHCYLDLTPDRKLGALGTEEWKRIFRELKEEGGLFLTLSGGELLLRKDWYELASHARALGFALRLYTNGTLIDDATADRIAELKPLGVEISLLGGIAATHDAVVRRRGAFEKTLAGIRRLRERNIATILKCVVMGRNAREIDELRRIGESLGCAVYFDFEISPKNNGSTAPKDTAAAETELLSAARRVLGDAMEDATLVLDREERLEASPCGAGRRTCHIGPTGTLHPCTQWVTPIGSLREKSFRELWRESAELARIRRVRTSDFDPCNRCDLLDICSPCMALSLLERGETGGPSPTKCASTELRAKALGMTKRSAWLVEQEERGDAGASVSMRRTELVTLRRKSPRRAELRDTRDMRDMRDTRDMTGESKVGESPRST